MGVFKTYDIRGVWDVDIDADLAYAIGRAAGSVFDAQTYMVGFDARAHSPEVYEAVVRGLVEEGREVTGIGLASTPMLHFLQIDGGFQAGIMVTASHNPKEYHGMKFFDALGGSISYEKGLDRIRKRVESWSRTPATATGRFSEVDRFDRYLSFLKSVAEGIRFDLRVVVDVSNGSSGRVFLRLAEELGIQAQTINAQPDGDFPAHDPNPLKEESLHDVTSEIRAAGADFGAVVDGDGDRILFVDERGHRIENSFLAALIGQELLVQNPGAAIVYDLISSRALPERIREAGGRPVVSRVGYTFLYDQMVRESAIFGSETSGHVYFRVSDTYYTESAAYALIVLMKLLSKRREKLSELIAPLKSRYAQSGEINVEVDDTASALQSVREAFAGGRIAGARIDDLDGISVELDDSWFNVRPSNTEPVLRVRIEGRSREAVEIRKKQLLGILNVPH